MHGFVIPNNSEQFYSFRSLSNAPCLLLKPSTGFISPFPSRKLFQLGNVLLRQRGKEDALCLQRGWVDASYLQISSL